VSGTKRLLVLLSTLLLTTAAGKKATPEPPPPVGVTVTRSGAARVVRAVLPGSVSALELPRQADGRLAIAIVLGEETRTLHRLDLEMPAGEEPLRPLLGSLPKGALGALDLDGDGAEELLLATEEALHSLGSIAMPRPPTRLLDAAGSELLLPSRWAERSLPGVAISEVGRARLFVPRRGALVVELDTPLPTRAVRQSDGIRLSSPRLQPIDGNPARLAAAPQAVGRQRMRTLLLGPEGAGEVWSLLPAAEDFEEAHYATIDGGPALIVSAMDADKLGIFAGKKLRIFALGADRTQAGHPPILAAQTSSHRWFPVATDIADVDRDGHDDVIVTQRDGMGGGETVVETFFGRGEGGFATPGRRQKWEIKGQATRYGADLSGDGIPDLAVLDAEGLNVIPGTADPRRALLAREPIRVPVAVGGLQRDWVRTLRVADLDADGKSEAILLGAAAKERDAILVVSLDRAAPGAKVNAAGSRSLR
jgi:hypothetical protein